MEERSSARRGLKLVAVLIPAVAFIVLLAIPTLQGSGPPEPGDDAPAFEAALLDDEGSLALADLRGTPVVLNFWASWCVPCRDEAPMLSRAAEEYAGRVSFVGINVSDARSDALVFADDYDLDFPHVRDEDRRIYNDYGLTGQPETFFIDGRGEIVEHVNGPVPDEATLTALLDLLVRRDG